MNPNNIPLPHRLSVEWRGSEMLCWITTAKNEHIQFKFTPELQELFETQMFGAIKSKENDNSKRVG